MRHNKRIIEKYFVYRAKLPVEKKIASDSRRPYWGSDPVPVGSRPFVGPKISTLSSEFIFDPPYSALLVYLMYVLKNLAENYIFYTPNKALCVGYIFIWDVKIFQRMINKLKLAGTVYFHRVGSRSGIGLSSTLSSVLQVTYSTPYFLPNFLFHIDRRNF
jgi:hypothetical protein